MTQNARNDGAHGYFVDWNGNARRTDDPGGDYRCEIDRPARYVGITTQSGTLVHEATFYRDLDALARAGIRATVVDSSHPWGERGEF